MSGLALPVLALGTATVAAGVALGWVRSLDAALSLLVAGPPVVVAVAWLIGQALAELRLLQLIRRPVAARPALVRRRALLLAKPRALTPAERAATARTLGHPKSRSSGAVTSGRHLRAVPLPASLCELWAPEPEPIDLDTL